MPHYSFERSRALIAEAKQYMPGGVNSFARLGVSPTPLVFEKAEGPYLYDVDGNRIIDYYMGLGPIIIGHRPPEVIAAVKAQLELGVLYSGQTELEFEAARLICEMVPCAERVRFAVSGTEAVQLALRLARAATGRSTVIKFEGHYHGWMDSVLWSVSPPVDAAGPEQGPIAVPGSLGQDLSAGEHLEVQAWNRPEFLLARIRRGDVAAVIMEASMCNTGALLPVKGYLEAVRQACTETGTLLIFDEVITGFRVAPGGAQQYLGVTPDLATFAKAVANGFPVAALAGKAEVMDLLAGGKVVHGGTYNAQPVAMAATVATLKLLQAPGFYEGMTARGTRLMQGIEAACRAAGFPVWVKGFPQIFYVGLGMEEQPLNYRGMAEFDRALYVKFTTALLERGVRTTERGAWFLCADHDDEAIDATLDAVKGALAAIS